MNPKPKKEEEKVISKIKCPNCNREYSYSGVKIYIGDRGVCVSKKCASVPHVRWRITKVTYKKS